VGCRRWLLLPPAAAPCCCCSRLLLLPPTAAPGCCCCCCRAPGHAAGRPLPGRHGRRAQRRPPSAPTSQVTDAGAHAAAAPPRAGVEPIRPEAVQATLNQAITLINSGAPPARPGGTNPLDQTHREPLPAAWGGSPAQQAPPPAPGPPGPRPAGRLQEAVQLLDAVLQASPTQVAALVGRGSARAMLGDVAGALGDLSAAIKLEPRSAPRALLATAACRRRQRAARHLHSGGPSGPGRALAPAAPEVSAPPTASPPDPPGPILQVPGRLAAARADSRAGGRPGGCAGGPCAVRARAALHGRHPGGAGAARRRAALGDGHAAAPPGRLQRGGGQPGAGAAAAAPELAGGLGPGAWGLGPGAWDGPLPGAGRPGARGPPAFELQPPRLLRRSLGTCWVSATR
jgi:hypothetical protein